jgi:hypothetical protein
MGTTVPERVILFYWGERPPTTMLALVVEERQLQLISSPVELAGGGPPADVVVVDVPAKYRRAACEQVRRHYRGRLVVLLDPEDSSYDLPPDPNRTLLTYPFGLHELSAALAGSASVQPTGDPRLIQPPKAQVEDADSSPGMERRVVAEVVPWLAQSWWERRLVRLSTISVTAALLLVVAFVLVTRGTDCGPACDRLTGPDLTAPSSSTVTAAAVGPTATASSMGPAAAGGSQADPPTSSSPGRTRTAAGPSGASSPSSPPDPTRPSSTAPPPTTAPPTTTTSTATTTTSTATTTTAPPHPTPPPHPTKP